MSSRSLCKCCVIIGGWLLSLATLDTAMAQWSPVSARPVRSLDRWLGIGYSAGYHWRDPGPNTDYYHPYSDLHSTYSGLPATLEFPPPIQSLPLEEQAPLQQPVGEQSSRERLNPAPLSGPRPGVGREGFGWGSGSQAGPGNRSGGRQPNRGANRGATPRDYSIGSRRR